MHFPLWALTLTSFVVHSVSIPPNDLIVNFSSRSPLHPNLLDNSATMNHLWLLLSSNTLEYSAAPSPLIQATAVCNRMHSPPPSSSDARMFNDTGLSSSWLSTFVEHCFSLVLPHIDVVCFPLHILHMMLALQILAVWLLLVHLKHLLSLGSLDFFSS